MSEFLPWRVLHVSADQPCPDLEPEAGIGGVFMVFWAARIPLGQLSIVAAQLPLSGAQLATMMAPIVAHNVGHQVIEQGFEPPLPVPPELQIAHAGPQLPSVLAVSRPIEALVQRASAVDVGLGRPSVSVVICTRNRSESLARCLRSLSQLSPGPEEVLVVDNEPAAEGTREVVERFPRVRYVAEPKPGLSAARNRGVVESRGDVIAFTDDDVVVHERWVDATRRAFVDGEDVMAVTGLVLPAELRTRAQYVFQSDTLGWGWGYRNLDFDRTFFDCMKRLGAPAWRLGAGANMAFRREVFARVGLFDERLGAGASGCSEDSELWYRLLAEGYRCRYTPASVVFHHHRADWEGLRQQMHSYMRGHVAALFFQFARYRHWGNLYRAFVAVPAYLARLGLHSIKQRLGRWLYESESASLTQPAGPQILGAIAGYAYAVRHRRHHYGPAKAGHYDSPAKAGHYERAKSSRPMESSR